MNEFLCSDRGGLLRHSVSVAEERLVTHSFNAKEGIVVLEQLLLYRVLIQGTILIHGVLYWAVFITGVDQAGLRLLSSYL